MVHVCKIVPCLDNIYAQLTVSLGLNQSALSMICHDSALSYTRLHAQQTQDVEPMLDECWHSVEDDGPTFNQHWLKVSC